MSRVLLRLGRVCCPIRGLQRYASPAAELLVTGCVGVLRVGRARTWLVETEGGLDFSGNTLDLSGRECTT